MHGGDWVELRRGHGPEPVRRVPTTSAYWFAVGIVRARHGLEGSEMLPAGTYLVDDGEVAIVIEVAADGTMTFGLDATCPPNSEWAGTSTGPQGKPEGSEKPPAAG